MQPLSLSSFSISSSFLNEVAQREFSQMVDGQPGKFHINGILSRSILRQIFDLSLCCSRCGAAAAMAALLPLFF